MSFFKRFAVVCLVLILSLATVSVAAADPGDRAGKEGKGPDSQRPPATRTAVEGANATGKELKIKESAAKRHGIVGTVKAKDADADPPSSLTLDTKRGEVVIEVNQDTKYKVPGKKDASLDDITVGARVAVRVTKEDSTLTALKVHLIPGKPLRIHGVGEVTAVAVDNTSITVKNKKGEETTFTVNSDTKIMPEGKTPEIGNIVTVVARRVPSEQTWLAKAIVIHKPKEE